LSFTIARSFHVGSKQVHRLCPQIDVADHEDRVVLAAQRRANEHDVRGAGALVPRTAESAHKFGTSYGAAAFDAQGTFADYRSFPVNTGVVWDMASADITIAIAISGQVYSSIDVGTELRDSRGGASGNCARPMRVNDM
jgi:hypothetical protein